MLARAFETAGVATTSISMVREHTAKVKPPRALFVPFPFGHALDLLAEPSGPVLRDFPDDAEDGREPPAPVQASAIAPSAGVPADAAAELAEMRVRYEQWVGGNGGRTAFGLSGVPAARFSAVIEFLQGFAGGHDADMAERPRTTTLPAFIRWCADDLKTLAYESYMAMRPEAGGDEVMRWFWSTTAIAQLLRRVRDRLDASDDPAWKAAAFGVAR